MLIDTSGLLCLFNGTEPFHKLAIDLFDVAPAKIIHNYVLAEFVPLITSRKLHRNKALDFLADNEHSHEIELIWVAPAIHDAAVTLLFNRPDKYWSLCDAVSFVIMKQRRIHLALTTDTHSEQAGFRRLLI